MSAQRNKAGFALPSRPDPRRPNANTKPSSTLGKRSLTAFGTKRHRAGHHDNGNDSSSGSDAEDGRQRRGMAEAISGFDEEGAVTATRGEANKKLVIPRTKNADWREQLKRRRRDEHSLPEEERRRREALNGPQGPRQEGVDVVNSEESAPQWGLTIPTRSAEDSVDEAEEAREVTVLEERPKTEDELALEALLGNESRNKRPDLVIPSTSGPAPNGFRTAAERDSDAFRRAVDSAPDVSTLEDYDRVPVEEFGAALLRGMGWDGKMQQVRDVKRRQNLLGLGATALKEAEELGAWDHRAGRGGGSKRRQTASDYRRDKERREERREQRYGDGYRRDRDRDRDRHRSRR